MRVSDAVLKENEAAVEKILKFKAKVLRRQGVCSVSGKS